MVHHKRFLASNKPNDYRRFKRESVPLFLLSRAETFLPLKLEVFYIRSIIIRIVKKHFQHVTAGRSIDNWEPECLLLFPIIPVFYCFSSAIIFFLTDICSFRDRFKIRNKNARSCVHANQSPLFTPFTSPCSLSKIPSFQSHSQNHESVKQR